MGYNEILALPETPCALPQGGGALGRNTYAPGGLQLPILGQFSVQSHEAMKSKKSCDGSDGRVALVTLRDPPRGECRFDPRLQAGDVSSSGFSADRRAPRDGQAQLSLRSASSLKMRGAVNRANSSTRASVDRTGKEPLRMRGSAHIDFSTAIIACKLGEDRPFGDLIDTLGAEPIVLCCQHEPLPTGRQDVRFLTIPPCPEAIVDALKSVLERRVHSSKERLAFAQHRTTVGPEFSHHQPGQASMRHHTL
jgi:hypothetical protein